MSSRARCLVSAFVFIGCASSAPEPGAAVRGDSVVDVAKADGRFGRLLRLLQKTELDDLLERPGTYTVFAPTDAAFEELGSDFSSDALKAENRAKLEKVLRFHVADVRLDRQAVTEMTRVSTLAGESLSIEKNEDRLLVGNAVVVDADIAADNGIIHAIDHVLRPPESPLEADPQSETTGRRKGGPDAWWW